MSLENRFGPFGPEENQKTTRPHGGGKNVPEEVRERPVGKEYDTPLDVANKEGFVKIPDTPYEGFEEKIPTEQEKEAWRRKLETGKKTRKPLYIGLASAAGLAVVGGTLFGLNAAAKNNESPETPTQPTAEAPVDPSVSAEPTEAPIEPASPSPTDIPVESFTPTPTPVESTESTTIEQGEKYSTEELRSMDVEKFVELPLKNRDALVVNMLEYSAEWQSGEFGENFIDKDDSSLYKYNPIEIASKDNTLEEIVMQDLYMQQLAFTQTENMETSGTFSPDHALKALSGAYISGDYLTSSAAETVTDTKGYELGVYNLPSVGEFRAEYAQEIDVLHDNTESGIETITTPDGRELTVASAHYEVVLTEDAGKIYPADTRITYKNKYVFHPEIGRWFIYDTWSQGSAGVK